LQTAGIGAIELPSEEKRRPTQRIGRLDYRLASDARETGPRDVLLLDDTLLLANALRLMR
jgi:hypothetical protein